MAQFLTTKGISSKIEDIIRRSTKDVYLVSPYLKLSRTFFERLKDIEEKNVTIHIIYGKDDLNKNQKELICNLKNLKLYYLDHLHAKCFANEKELIITSMNMHEYSEMNNREMGILIQKQNNEDLYADALDEIKSIIKAAYLESDTTVPLPASPEQTQSIENNIEEDVLLSDDEYDRNTFHLEMLFEKLKELVKNAVIFYENNGNYHDEIIINEYPHSGVKMLIRYRITLNFNTMGDYNSFKYRYEKQLDDILSDYRVYWNRGVIHIYLNRSTVIKLSTRGRIELCNLQYDIIQRIHSLFNR